MIKRYVTNTADPEPKIFMEEVTDPKELARARAQRARFDRNSAWLQAHGAEIYPRHRGKFICIAGEELFVADTAEEAIALAEAAHPEDDGRFLYYIRKEVNMANERPPIIMEVVTDPNELARARVQRERSDRNAAWLQAHAAEIYPRYRGKCICVAGEELFVADTAKEVLALARAAHPDDNGYFLHYIPRVKAARIYADYRRMVRV